MSISHINISSVKIDFVKPLIKSKAKLEMGAKTSFVTSDNDMIFWYSDKSVNGKAEWQELISAIDLAIPKCRRHASAKLDWKVKKAE